MSAAPFSLPGENRTLQVGPTILALLMLFVVAEASLRVFVFFKPSLLLPPTYRIPHPQFGYKIETLDRFESDNGGVECIFLGSSPVFRGVDPQVFQEIYHEETGYEISCFNFGLQGLKAAEAGPVAELLSNQYHPRFFVYGSTVRDYSDLIVQTSILRDPWVRYQMGEPTLQAWLDMNTLSHRYFFVVAHFFRFGTFIEPDPNLREDGAKPLIERAYDRSITEHLPGNYANALLNYQRMSVLDQEGLRQLINLQTQGVEILLVEMPLPPGYVDYLPDGAESYAAFVDELQQVADEEEVILLRVNHANYGEDLWFDFHHLNEQGAIEFSTWLAQQIAALEE